MRKILFLFSLFFLSILKAQEAGDFVVLPEEKVHQGDYFAAGGSIEISGVVQGDVYAFGSQIVVNGRVEGDLIATGGSIAITGTVIGNARLAGAQIELKGTIGRNATILGGNIHCFSQSMISNNAIIMGSIINLAGSIGGNVTMTASNASLSGRIKGNVKAYVGQVFLDKGIKIGGNFEYSSNQPALINQGAEIQGKVLFHASEVGRFLQGEWKKKVLLGSKLAGILMNLFFSFVIGWIFIKIFPKRLRAVLLKIRQSPWKSIGIGLLVIIFIPIVCLVLLITIVGFPLALALIALSILTFYSAKIFPLLWVANRIFRPLGFRTNSLWGLFLGLILFFLATQTPILGSLLSLIFMLMGIGAVVLSRVSKAKL